MNIAFHKVMTREEFFDWAQAQDGKYEFDGVRPVAVVGGTNSHGLIARNILVAAMLRLRGGPCQVIGSGGGGVAVPGNGLRYPDATVTCSPVPGRERLCPDPVVVFEVVSPSTERTDLVAKLREYHAVPSIRRYVLIEQDGMAATIHSRSSDEPWITSALLEGGMLAFPEIGIEIPLADLYEGVTFDGGQA